MKLRPSELVIFIQLVAIAILAAMLYSEYTHNQYFQAYLYNFWLSNYQRILLGMILAVAILVVVDGLWPIFRKREGDGAES